MKSSPADRRRAVPQARYIDSADLPDCDDPSIEAVEQWARYRIQRDARLAAIKKRVAELRGEG